MSPVLILSRLCLKRRFQFFGISDTSSESTREDLLDRLLVDDAAQARLAGVLTRDHDGHVVVEDLDREVLAHLAEDVLLLLLDDLAGPMMGIDDVVADLEVDALDLARDLEVLDLLDRAVSGMVSSFDQGRSGCRTVMASCLQVAVHEVDLLQAGEGPRGCPSPGSPRRRRPTPARGRSRRGSRPARGTRGRCSAPPASGAGGCGRGCGSRGARRDSRAC